MLQRRHFLEDKVGVGGCFSVFLIFVLYWSVVNNIGLASGTQQSDSVIHIHASILFQILFPFR